jgi:hypothetical protein
MEATLNLQNRIFKSLHGNRVPFDFNFKLFDWITYVKTMFFFFGSVKQCFIIKKMNLGD